MKSFVSAAAFAACLAGCGEYSYEGRAVAAPTPVAVAPADDADDAYLAAAPAGDAEGDELFVGAESDTYLDTDPSALVEFRTALDPYGDWTEDGTYGTVWIPSSTVVGPDFSPYVTAGHWSYVDDYVWVSDYEWGWAPFHYGRWVYIAGRGWAWIPGRTYAGAWVTWRTGYDGWGYVGWAPMAPTWHWRHGHAYGLSVVPHAPWAFCTHGDLFAPSVGHRVVTGPQVSVVAGHTRPFTPASPTVGGRTPASPSVGGGRPSGPPPRLFGYTNGAPVSALDRGVARAQQLARPSTALALGARPPANQPAFRSPQPLRDGRASRTISSGADNPAAWSRPAPLAHPTAPPPMSRSIGTSRAFGGGTMPMSRPPTAAAPVVSAPTNAPPAFSRPASPTYGSPSFSPPAFSRPTVSAPSHAAPPPAAIHMSPAPASRAYAAPSQGSGGGARTFSPRGRR